LAGLAVGLVAAYGFAKAWIESVGGPFLSQPLNAGARAALGQSIRADPTFLRTDNSPMTCRLSSQARTPSGQASDFGRFEMRMLLKVASRPRLRGRTGVLAVVTLAMLIGAGGALAWHGFSSASAVSATFSANTVSNSQSQSCTASNHDSIQVTDATFVGTASSSDPHLNGPITINARSVYDATTNVGTVSGDVSVNTSGGGFEGRLITVNVAGHLQGLLVGSENGGGELLGNVSSTFSTTTGFGSSSSLGTIGSGTATNTAIVSTGSCASAMGDNDQDDDNGNGNFAGSGKFGDIGTFSGSGEHNHQGGGDSQD
jgi:hypothetical protein